MDDALVSLRDVQKSFSQAGDEVEVLRGVSLEIERGEFVAVQGASGSGKSTLLHVIGLLEQPTSGTYLLSGSDVSHLSDDTLSDMRNQVTGFVFQSFHLVPYASALDNVMLPGLYSSRSQSSLRERALELLSLVGLSERATFRPGQLSGGQQQRVALARALINDPDLILADEPTGQLDSATSDEIMGLIASINERGKTIVLVTHDEPTAGYAKRRIHITDGLVDAS